MPYQATWFDQNIPYWSQYLAPFKGKPNLDFLEIGCFEGRATVWLLENILTDQTSSITVIDTFQGNPEFPLFGIDNNKIEPHFQINTQPYKEKIRVCPGSSRDYFRSSNEQQFDFVYVDGSHTCIDVLRDGVNAFDRLKAGGMIIFDDYQWDVGRGEKERPYAAIHALIGIWGGYYGKWSFWLNQAAFHMI